jgi:hypothetical protein
MNSNELEEIDDLLMGVETGETLFAMLCAYHPEAINWEVEDYHSATQLACQQWKNVSLPWNVNDIEEGLLSNKTHLKSLVKAFMIDLLMAVESQSTQK